MERCPKCGFDLNPKGVCPVCGYGSASDIDTSASVRPKTHAARQSRGRNARTAVGVIAMCVGVVVAALVVVKLSTVGHGGATTALPETTGSTGNAQLSKEAAQEAEAQTVSHSATSPDAPSLTQGHTTPSSRICADRTATSTRVVSDETQQLYHYPVGASPASLRASKSTNLYDPAVQPVYDIAQRSAADFPPITSEDAYVGWMVKHTAQSKAMIEWRWKRAEQIVERGLVIHANVLMAFLLTPREWFDRPYNYPRTYAYDALPIGYGQTISGPELVAHMTDELDVSPKDRVLEIGTGSGYQSAVLSQLSNCCYTIEIVKPLAEETDRIYLKRTKEIPEYANIYRRLADGYYGWPKHAPFDRIIVTTGIDRIPPELLRELKPGGIMLIPIGPPSGQIILKITKTVDKDGNIHLKREDIYHGFKREIFVPFTAAGGGTHNIGARKPLH